MLSGQPWERAHTFGMMFLGSTAGARVSLIWDEVGTLASVLFTRTMGYQFRSNSTTLRLINLKPTRPSSARPTGYFSIGPLSASRAEHETQRHVSIARENL
jgi:hypothetical protein